MMAPIWPSDDHLGTRRMSSIHKESLAFSISQRRDLGYSLSPERGWFTPRGKKMEYLVSSNKSIPHCFNLSKMHITEFTIYLSMSSSVVVPVLVRIPLSYASIHLHSSTIVFSTYEHSICLISPFSSSHIPIPLQLRTSYFIFMVSYTHTVCWVVSSEHVRRITPYFLMIL